MSLCRKLISTLAVFALAGCHSVHFIEVVTGRVYVPFANVGDWNVYGVGGALQSRIFIKPSQTPASYSYTDYSSTGFGGVILLSTIHNELLCFDLSCPVEHSRDVRVFINESNYAECPECHSIYDVFQLDSTMPGIPLSGPALSDEYKLTLYRVAFGADGCYALLTN